MSQNTPLTDTEFWQQVRETALLVRTSENPIIAVDNLVSFISSRMTRNSLITSRDEAIRREVELETTKRWHVSTLNEAPHPSHISVTLHAQESRIKELETELQQTATDTSEQGGEGL